MNIRCAVDPGRDGTFALKTPIIVDHVGVGVQQSISINQSHLKERITIMHDLVEWRTPNGWVFVVACQVCGRVATSHASIGTCYLIITNWDDCGVGTVEED